MDRRTALATLSGVLTTTAFAAMPQRSVLAQTTATNPPGEPSGSAAAGAPLGETRWRSNTLLIGTFAKQTSALALQKATHPKVKEFAQFEYDEQTTVAQTITDTSNPPPAPLDQQHTALLKQLQGQSGKAFDTAYVQGQISGHQQLLNIQQGFLNSVPTNRDHKHIAMLARTVIQMHLAMLTDLQNTLA